MRALVASLRFNLARLLDFSGRETGGLFWPYTIFVVIGSGVIGMGFIMPMFAKAFSRMQQFVVTHPDQATISLGPGNYSIQIRGHHPELMPDIRSFLLVAIVVNLFVLALLAAGVTRRLHDCDRRGWWGLLPVPFGISGVALMLKVFEDMGDAGPDMQLFFAAFVNNVVYLATLGFLILLLVRPGTRGSNRFGPEQTTL